MCACVRRAQMYWICEYIDSVGHFYFVPANWFDRYDVEKQIFGQRNIYAKHIINIFMRCITYWEASTAPATAAAAATHIFKFKYSNDVHRINWQNVWQKMRAQRAECDNTINKRVCFRSALITVDRCFLIFTRRRRRRRKTQPFSSSFSLFDIVYLISLYPFAASDRNRHVFCAIDCICSTDFKYRNKIIVFVKRKRFKRMVHQ